MIAMPSLTEVDKIIKRSIYSGVRRIYFSRGRKLFLGGAESRPKEAKKISAPPVFVSAPPAEFDSAPGAEQTRGGAENL